MSPIRRKQWLALGVSLLLLLTISLGSHAATEAEPILPVLADWLHLLAASIWIGGLIAFVAGLWAVQGFDIGWRTRLAAGLIPRFSAPALLSVAVLILSGLYASVLRIGTLTALAETLYGQTLLVKLLIALPMLALGGVNLIMMRPAMHRAAAHEHGNATPVSRFQRLVSGEVLLGVALLLSVGVLTAQSPPQISAALPGLDAAANVDDLNVALNISPGRAGFNSYAVSLTANGEPVEKAKEVALTFTPATAGLPPSEVSLTEQGNGQYTATGAYLSLPDRWQVRVVVRREGRFDSFAGFDFEITAPEAPAAQTPFSWHQVNGLLLLVEGLALFFAFSRVSRTRSQVIFYATMPALALALAGIVIFYRTPTIEDTATAGAAPTPTVIPLETPTPAFADIVNPIPADAGSIARGQALFQNNCVKCHGLSGRGDGPLSSALVVPPADLTYLAAPGQFSDGQLFVWISNGSPATQMPSFQGSLSEEERWLLVNYLRTLAAP
jgi:copper transport protein